MGHSDHRTSLPGLRRRLRVALAATALSLCVATSGCGPGPEVRTGDGVLLTVGARRAAPSPARLRSGSALAERAAEAYVDGAYRRRAPVLPAETGSVSSALSGAARRVPAARRGLSPGLRRLWVQPVGIDRLAATVLIGDGTFKPFTIGLELHWRGRWRIVAISLPD
jgi:hypothetical protein